MHAIVPPAPSPCSQSSAASESSVCASTALPIKLEQLISVFHAVFFEPFNTQLIAHGQEPLYSPATPSQPAKIIFSHDYFASALHEVAHWCVAGAERRKLEDYGYWYAPDGRSEDQQKEFERVEVRPQALEWIFSVAAGQPFRVSADNLAQGLGPSRAFKQAICEQAQVFCREGLPPRPAMFVKALEQAFGQSHTLNPTHYVIDAL